MQYTVKYNCKQQSHSLLKSITKSDLVITCKRAMKLLADWSCAALVHAWTLRNKQCAFMCFGGIKELRWVPEERGLEFFLFIFSKYSLLNGFFQNHRPKTLITCFTILLKAMCPLLFFVVFFLFTTLCKSKVWTFKRLKDYLKQFLDKSHERL